jgi:hypothetical protein
MLRQEMLRNRSAAIIEAVKSDDNVRGILDRASVYLSGPMDFVKSRKKEKRFGWRTRVSQFLRHHGTTVFDPWNKPNVAGLPHYGKEDEFTTKVRQKWTFADNKSGRATRDGLCDQFWPTLHIDLRMTDLADFLIAYCPTNIYSVGTVHEIATARLQHKPVLLVTPRLASSAPLKALKARLRHKRDNAGLKLLKELSAATSDKPNRKAIPSLWYMAMLECEDYFFDGFGFAEFAEEMDWPYYEPLDEREKRSPPLRPLLPYLKKLNTGIPKSYDVDAKRKIENPEWLIFLERDVVQHSAGPRRK